jgi:transposase
MKSAPSTRPEEAPNGLTCGIDWARDDHAVSVVDARGRQVRRCVIEHSAAGLRALTGMLGKRGVSEAAIERPDGPVVETLLEAGVTVVVISPNQVKNLRGRYGSVLVALNEQVKALTAQISEQLALHADQQVFTSLPRSGRVRAARLLAEIGDCRARFPTPESLACLAGVAASTRQSGKIRAVGFRWSCDKQLGDAVTDFAGDTRHASPWAARLYDDAIARGHDHPHAVRILARAWLFVIWHCWQDNVACDPARHKTLQRILAEEKTKAA